MLMLVLLAGRCDDALEDQRAQHRGAEESIHRV